jgi:adenylate kinase
MASGVLVPDALTCAIVEERLAALDCDCGYVLDGFPRSLSQAEALEQMLNARGERLDVAICLDVPDDEIVTRLSARRTCPICGTIYNLKFDPPAGDASRCSRNGCAGVLIQRSDDNEETIRHRLVVYHQMTEPIVAFYRDRGLLTSIPGDISPDGVSRRIEEVLCALDVVREP